MSNRLENCFSALKKEDRAALVTYITAGDQSAEASADYVNTLIESGADIIELGMPFSDPMADGPVIQRASERSLAAGMTLPGVLELVCELRKSNDTTPVVLMGYLNPVEAMGYAAFAEAAKDAGVDGVLIVDMPPEEAGELNQALKTHAIEQIFLVSPNSSNERIAQVAELGGGFIYYVSVKGITGSAALDVTEVEARVRAFSEKIPLPVGVGFGIKNAEDAAAVGKFSDAVIVGSALVQLVEDSLDQPEQVQRNLATLTRSLRDGIDGSRAP